MQHPDRFIAVLLGVAFPIFTIWMVRKAWNEREVSTCPNVKILRFTKSFRTWLYVCILLFILGFSSDLYLGKVEPDGQLSFWFTFFGFAVLLGASTWFVVAYRVEYDEESLTIYWPTGRNRRILWSNVISAELKKGTGIVLRLQSGKKQVISASLPGSNEFLKEAHARANRAA